MTTLFPSDFLLGEHHLPALLTLSTSPGCCGPGLVLASEDVNTAEGENWVLRHTHLPGSPSMHARVRWPVPAARSVWNPR